MTSKCISAMAALILLSACGGSTSPYETKLDALEAIIQRFDDENLDYTPVANIPVATAPTYDGFFLAAVPGESYVGDLTMTADFVASTISGTGTNTFDSDGRRVTGTIFIDETSIDRTADPDFEYQIVTTLGGVLTDADGVVLTVAGDFDGDFLDTNAESLFAELNGTVDSFEYGNEVFTGIGVADR